MNFKDMQNEVSELLNFNSSQTDQDFTTAQIKGSINRAYARELRKARQEGSKRYFITTKTIAWPSGQVTLELPQSVRQRQIVQMTDITNSDPGYLIVFDDNGFLGDVHWKDRNTLQWGKDGPNEAKTIRVQYMPVAESMVADDDEPEFMAPDHHELIYYSAAIDLRQRADEMAPGAWVVERETLRMDFYKDCSRGRPYSDIQTIGPGYTDTADFIY